MTKSCGTPESQEKEMEIESPKKKLLSVGQKSVNPFSHLITQA